jgi:hypothetical protein
LSFDFHTAGLLELATALIALGSRSGIPSARGEVARGKSRQPSRLVANLYSIVFLQNEDDEYPLARSYSTRIGPRNAPSDSIGMAVLLSRNLAVSVRIMSKLRLSVSATIWDRSKFSRGTRNPGDTILSRLLPLQEHLLERVNGTYTSSQKSRETMERFVIYPKNLAVSQITCHAAKRF